MPRNGGGGRIRPHERSTDDDAAIIGADIEVLEEHSTSVRDTEQKTISERNKRNYRNRIKHICSFFEEKYPTYFSVGVRALTDAELSDPDQFWWKNTYDLVYQGMNVKMIKAFLAHKKTKANGKTSSHVQLRKYNDAIIFGAKSANQRLPQGYYEEMEKYLGAFKKETMSAKKDGMLDEQEADPISRTLFRMILQWGLQEKNVFLWVFTILQWNCMSRSINIGGLALHCFRPGEDNLTVKYDKSKADQSGEKLHEKHLYDNPFDPLVSVFLALGVWFSLEASRFEQTEALFQDDTKGENAASQRYCSQLCHLFEKHADQLKQYIRVNHANTHGVRKGSATSASSGTTCPPPVSSIAARGEWSLGKVLDLYWHFAEPGDTYLGRVLAGLDPNSPEFATLPPHWKTSNPMANEKINEGMNLMFATILQKWSGTPVDPTGVLLVCLASVVYHSEFLKEIAVEFPGHPFSLIPLLSNPQLLGELNELVTLERGGQMTTPTGIPPHVTSAVMMQKIFELCETTLKTIKSLTEDIKVSVKEAFEEKAEENGQVTGERLKNMLDEYQNSMTDLIEKKLTALRDALPNQSALPHEVAEGAADDNNAGFADGEEEEVSFWEIDAGGNTTPPTRITYRQYSYDGRFWHVPKDFEFPTGLHLDTAWKIWICGLPANETIDKEGSRCQAPIRPIRALKLDMMPKKVKQNFQLHWRPIFSMMEQAPGLIVRQDIRNVDAAYLTTSFVTAKVYLKTRVSYVFMNRRANPDGWEISTWSRMVQRSSIMKHGTDDDKANLPGSTSNRNQPRVQRGRQKSLADQRRVRRRLIVAYVPPPPAPVAVPAQDEGANELPDLRGLHSARALARAQEIEEDVTAEIAGEQPLVAARLGGSLGTSRRVVVGRQM